MMRNNTRFILDETPSESLKGIIKEIYDHFPEIYSESLLEAVKEQISGQTPLATRLLEERWYDSVENGAPDYSVYNHPDYFIDVITCWIKCSRNYLRRISSDKSLPFSGGSKSIISDMNDVKTVLDLGCSFGYTTASLVILFQDADVYGTNIPESPQYKIASDLGQRYGFKVLSEYVTRADLVFASEYFEHFERPIDHLKFVLTNVKPRYMIISNGFNARAIGHFWSYKDGDSIYTSKLTHKIFNETLKSFGYVKQKTKCWNNKPEYWKLETKENAV